MIVLFCDFALPYTGQMRLAIERTAPGTQVVDLFTDVPRFEPKFAAYLLPAYACEVPEGAVVLCVVDPGVGSERAPVVVKADGRWYVGPDNGLFSQIIRRASNVQDSCVQAWRIDWRPETPLSTTFHGRDLFSPIAARLSQGNMEGLTSIDPATLDRRDWPDDLAAVIYIDSFGNALTGMRSSQADRIAVNGQPVNMSNTYSEVEVGHSFAYVNSNGLIEIAVNQGSAAESLGLSVGCQVLVTKE